VTFSAKWGLAQTCLILPLLLASCFGLRLVLPQEAGAAAPAHTLRLPLYHFGIP
jgi:hypothetical protein